MPRDKRVPFTPAQCVILQKEFGINLIVQPSAWRCFADVEYTALGIKLQDDVSDCDVLIGIKEVQKSEFIAGKKYLFFSHTFRQISFSINTQNILS